MTSRKDRTYWLTPPEVYDPLHAVYKFDFDPCPHPMPAWDGLTRPWGKSNFVNPPHGDGGPGIKPWVRKALQERENGNASVMLLPVDPVMMDLLRAGPALYPLDTFQWLGPDGKSRQIAKPTVAFAIPAKVDMSTPP